MTTPGQILLNEALPEDLRDESRVWTAGAMEKVLAEVAKRYPEQYSSISHKLLQLGRHAVYDEAATVSLEDFANPIEKDRNEVLEHIREQSRKIQAMDIPAKEKTDLLDKVYAEARKFITDATYQRALENDNTFALQVLSKARGSPSVLSSLVSTPGTYTDPQGNTIPFFIQHSHSEGLTPAEYFAESFGARQGVVSTKFCLHEDTPVLMRDYTAKAIKDLKPGDAVWTVDADDRLLGTEVSAVCDTGVKPCYDWSFGPGKRSKTVAATAEHTVYMQYRQAGGDHDFAKVLAPLDCATRGRRAAILPKPRLDGVREPRAFILGALIGDGGISGHNTNIYVSDDTLRDYLLKTLPAFNMTLGCPTEMPGCTRYIVTEIVGNGAGSGVKTPFRTWLQELGLLGLKAPAKFVPDVVYTWDIQSVVEFIAGLVATDGSASMATNQYGLQYPTLSCASSSPTLIADLKRLMQARLFMTTSFGDVRSCAGTHSEIYGRATNRNHDMHSILVSDYTSQAVLLPYMPVDAATKFRRWAALMNSPRRRKANLTTRFKSRSEVFYAKTVDIEVTHHSHMFVLANGLIVGNSTRDAGDLGKQFNQASMRMVVTKDDCGTAYGMPAPLDSADTRGTVLSRQMGKYPPGTVLTKEVLSDIKEETGSDEVVVRSPITCGMGAGVCSHCAGVREGNKLPAVGEHIGINAASALAERIAQGSLNTKHSGGQTQGDGSQVYAGFDVIRNLFQVPKHFPHAAAIADVDGKVDSVEEAPQGGWNIDISGNKHYVSPDLNVSVKPGDIVEAGDQLSSGIANPADIIKHKGLGEGRRYFAERATQAFRESGYAMNKRNMEVLTRALLDSAVVEDPDSGSEYLPGDVVSYSSLAHRYKPREGSSLLDLNQAHGKYLEEPVMHYTIGTRITPSVTKQLQKFGYQSAVVNDREPGFRPQMIGLRRVPQQEKDWMAQLGSSHLQKNLLENTHRGAQSDFMGGHPVPAVAHGKEIGKAKAWKP